MAIVNSTKEFVEKVVKNFAADRSDKIVVSFPVLREHNGEYYIALFFALQDEEGASKNLSTRPVKWRLYDINTFSVVEKYDTNKDEFSKGNYLEDYPYLVDGAEEKFDDMYSLFDEIRDDYIKRHAVNNFKYKKYIKTVKGLYNKKFQRFYDELSFYIPSSKIRKKKNEHQVEVGKMIKRINDGVTEENILNMNLSEIGYLTCAADRMFQKEENASRRTELDMLLGVVKTHFMKVVEKEDEVYVLFEKHTGSPFVTDGKIFTETSNKCILMFDSKNAANIAYEYYSGKYGYELNIRKYKGKNFDRYLKKWFGVDGYCTIILNSPITDTVVFDSAAYGYDLYTRLNYTPVTNKQTKVASIKALQMSYSAIPECEKEEELSIVMENLSDTLLYASFLCPVSEKDEDGNTYFLNISNGKGENGFSVYTDPEELKQSGCDSSNITTVTIESMITAMDSGKIDFILVNYRENTDRAVFKINKNAINHIKQIRSKLFKTVFAPNNNKLMIQAETNINEQIMSFTYRSPILNEKTYYDFLVDVYKEIGNIITPIIFKKNGRSTEVEEEMLVAQYLRVKPTEIIFDVDFGGNCLQVGFLPEIKGINFTFSRNSFIPKEILEAIIFSSAAKALRIDRSGEDADD